MAVKSSNSRPQMSLRAKPAGESSAQGYQDPLASWATLVGNSGMQQALTHEAGRAPDGTQLATLWPIIVTPHSGIESRCTDPNEEYSQEEIAALSEAVAVMNQSEIDSGENPVLSTDMMLNLYDAEQDRHSLADKFAEFVGLAGSYGQGQLTEDAMQDVVDKNGAQLTQFLENWNETHPHNQLDAPDMDDWKNVAEHPVFGAFFSTAFLQQKINQSEKDGRSQEDAVRFGVGRYHGGFNMMSKAQQRVNDTTNWQPVADHLRGGDTDQEDLVDYVNQVVGPRPGAACSPGPNLIA